MSALGVLLSLLLWSWVLGTVGAFLSVPLTMVLMIALEARPETRPISILLGPDLAKPPRPASAESAEATSRDPGTPPKRG
jgi:predicted PurR-regulated permease PerM